MGKESRSAKRWKILVTPSEACEHLRGMAAGYAACADFFPTYGRVRGVEKCINLLKDKDAAVLDLEKITPAVFKNCPRLKVLSRFGEGCDAIDLQSAKRHAVMVARTRAVSSMAVARHTMSLILAITHNTIENDRNLKRDLWIRRPNASDDRTTIGIIGFGRIGQAVAGLASGFGFPVFVYSRRCPRDNRYRYAADLSEVIEASDIITLHLPLTVETEKIISGRLLRKCAGKYIVNTSRGALVDELQLLDALDRGIVKGYATDVFATEPVNGLSKRLAKHKRVVCSPHVAALDKATAASMTRRAVDNALYCLKKEHDKVMAYVDR